MALYINNPDVEALADQLVAMTGKTKVAVVRDALQEASRRLKEQPNLVDNIRALQTKVKENGFTSMPDQKSFSDELSGGI